MAAERSALNESRVEDEQLSTCGILMEHTQVDDFPRPVEDHRTRREVTGRAPQACIAGGELECQDAVALCAQRAGILAVGQRNETHEGMKHFATKELVTSGYGVDLDGLGVHDRGLDYMAALRNSEGDLPTLRLK